MSVLNFDRLKEAIWQDKGKALREREAVWLINFCLETKPKIVLNIGTGWGVTARLFSLVADKVYSIDKEGCGYAKKMVDEHGDSRKIEYIQSMSADAVLPIDYFSADVCFIDAGHPTLYVIADFLKFSRYVKDGGWIIFHDCDRRDVVTAIDLILAQDARLQSGYSLEFIHAVDITRAYQWKRNVGHKEVDINRVDPTKAKKK